MEEDGKKSEAVAAFKPLDQIHLNSNCVNINFHS